MPRETEPLGPRYRAIAADLAAKIHAGEYAPGSALPAQRELSSAYGVTLMTLRQALRQLSDEGLIVQQAGRGTFVSPPHLAYRLGSLRSLADDLREQGHEVRTTVVARATGTPPGDLGDPALRLERVREFAGRPSVHQVSWVRLVPGLLDADFGRVPLYTALADAGVAVARATETIRPDVLPPSLIRYFERPAGTPVFVSDRVTYALDGTAVVADRAVILGDAMEIRAERAATGLSMRWSGASDVPA
ncbi:GntR family transcriptional regulator [Dactylosporangium sp. AC04546]|uniref:GntR family transcriptional regulator n=1 Tax=Dactylosporangium sp. AC04546 TaxID=2862460 RepID=UPI001EDD5E5A|nr:GntR family transcriptional regulator [Dactylosporangium sp. AC04546]WVK83032.1 GntR family transcriptional regulator [Dactylosporangium sp. AC04546]